MKAFTHNMTTKDYLIGIMLALVASFGITASGLSTKMLKELNVNVILFYYGLTDVILLTLAEVIYAISTKNYWRFFGY